MIPAVMLVLASCLVCFQLAGQQLRLQDAAVVTARSLARGDSAPAFPGAIVSTRADGDLLCARLTIAAGLPLLIELSAESCALA